MFGPLLERRLKCGRAAMTDRDVGSIPSSNGTVRNCCTVLAKSQCNDTPIYSMHVFRSPLPELFNGQQAIHTHTHTHTHIHISNRNYALVSKHSNTRLRERGTSREIAKNLSGQFFAGQVCDPPDVNHMP
jgi:hypothetical protein